MSIEQRKYPRIDTTDETIYFTIAQVRYGDSEQEDRIHHPGVITNTSAGGIGMRVSVPHDINEQLWLEGLEDSPAARAGTVRWVRDIDQGEHFELGLQF